MRALSAMKKQKPFLAPFAAFTQNTNQFKKEEEVNTEVSLAGLHYAGCI